MAEDKKVEPEKKIQSPSEMEAEMKVLAFQKARDDAEFAKLQVEQAKLSRENLALETEDLRGRVDDRKSKVNSKENRARINGNVIRSEKQQHKQIQSACSHRKGGDGLEGFTQGKGQDPQYAVLKHQFCNGDTWVRCLRCGKTWKPPVKSNFTNDGKLDDVAYQQGYSEYRIALDFPTRNTASGSVMFNFRPLPGKDKDVDAQEHYREVTKEVELR